MRRIMSQRFSISLKQKVDGQVQVTRIRVPKEILAEEPFLKQQIKKQMESMLERNNIKVMKDKGIVEYDQCHKPINRIIYNLLHEIGKIYR